MMESNNRITYRFDRNGQATSEQAGREKHEAVYNEMEVKGAADKGASGETKRSEGKKPSAADRSPSDKRGNVVPIYSDSYSTSAFSPWNSPFQEDVAALEKLIREAEEPEPSVVQPGSKEASDKRQQKPAQLDQPGKTRPQLQSQPQPTHAAPNRRRSNADLERDWMEEEHNDVVRPIRTGQEEYGPIVEEEAGNSFYRAVKQRSASPSWIKVFASVAAALATGALFGYLLLSLFTGSPIWPGAEGNGAVKPVDAPVVQPGGTGKEESAGTDKAGGEGGKKAVNAGTVSGEQSKTAHLSLPGQSYHLLQYGVFKSEEGLNAAIAELEGKGIAAAGYYTGTDYRAYAAMAVDRTGAAALADRLTGVEIYMKQVNVQVPQRFSFDGKAADPEAFFTSTAELVSMLDNLVLTQLEQPTLSPLGKAASDGWKDEYARWTDSVKAMQEGVRDEAGKAFLIKLIQAVQSAAESMTDYDKKPSESHLWTVQSALMKTVLTQKEWFERNSAL
ncbi:SPOR domain-containing protein [Paenibacillus sp. NPDC058071]|uniref:SPOR domain-containing protein n=1 Tax=Paenibacillus sp. NPDC058071 TaxID=3346326 RepID=UPI0036DD5C76